MLPHIAQKSFVQRGYRVVVANENVAAKGHFSQKCSEKSLHLTNIYYVFKEKSLFLECNATLRPLEKVLLV